MIVVSSREFRENQGKYLDMANDGQDIVLKSRGRGSFRLTPIHKDDALMSEEEFYTEIDHSIQQAKEGKVLKQHDGESVDDFVNRLLCTE
ncbi:MAG: type II toxin-antitoxin system prevent-host-death family antitoxin [Mediterranea sp.]|jgi:prevent-host-death family protein|nr:type II toxin-antitoxin system prevent-host-death family antitoxin [Mediterranea sp.]